MDRKVDSRAMREVNRSIIYDLIRNGGQVSRTDLARISSLTKPTVSTIVEELMAEGIVLEVGFTKSEPTGGRRARLLEFNPDSSAYIGLRFGVRSLSVAIANGLGHVVAERDGEAVVGDPGAALRRAREIADELLKEQGIPGTRVAAVGVAVGGLIDKSSGTCVLSKNLGWEDVPLRQLVQDEFDSPAVVFNVTDAATTAESRLGAARGVDNFVWIYCGTGIGAGLFADGQLFLGNSGFSGEIGFCRTSAGGPTLEELASGRAIVETCQHKSGQSSELSALGSNITLGDVLRLAEAGDAVCAQAVDEAGAALGLTVAHLVNIMNPEVVVIGGGVAEQSPRFLSAAREAVKAEVLGPETVPVVPSEITGQVITKGAVLLAMDHAVQSYRIVAT